MTGPDAAGARATSNRLRVAAIHFLNPAPLMWDFEHPPFASELSLRYQIQYTAPAICAQDLLAGRADLGLIPIAALTPALRIVPGCTIASLREVRSILLIVKSGQKLQSVRKINSDTASRSSIAYAQILFRTFLGADPNFVPCPATDPVAMLADADAALLIGDPALLAREARRTIEASLGPCLWIDLAELWHTHTGLPWVAAVWAANPASIPNPAQLAQDLQRSRDHGLLHIDDLVREWTPRLAIPPATIRNYLTQNIHYTLDPPSIEAIALFRKLAAEAEILPPLSTLNFL